MNIVIGYTHPKVYTVKKMSCKYPLRFCNYTETCIIISLKLQLQKRSGYLQEIFFHSLEEKWMPIMFVEEEPTHKRVIENNSGILLK